MSNSKACLLKLAAGRTLSLRVNLLPAQASWLRPQGPCTPAVKLLPASVFRSIEWAKLGPPSAAGAGVPGDASGTGPG